ncbi:hypothetical protein [Haloarchaeobius sp. HRN-SO-5]|uniref:hypothetical protein n=1 Tax=Haloarchaeobius sp. HRN-SO-5 TaxID=3446118 RepID=UPI003EC14665
MGTNDDVEACGRCSMSSVVETAGGDHGTNPFDGDRIELSDSELRTVNGHVVALGRLKDRLNRWARRLTYGR